MVKPQAVIVGAGLGGLAAAIALQRAGWQVRVVEQTPEFRQVGAGLTIGPSATRALDALGLGLEMRARADIPKRTSVLDYQTYAPVVERTDNQLRSMPGGTTWFHQMHRADFHRFLAEHAMANDPDCVILDAPVAGVDERNSSVAAVLAGGGTIEGDVLIAADGIRSVIRAQLFDDRSPRFTGQVAYRFLVPMEQAGDALGDFNSATIMGPKAIFTRYEIRGGEAVNCVAIVETNAWTGVGWSHPATRAEVLGHFGDWHPNVRKLIAAADESQIIKWALCDREPLADWRSGRVALLGDAAHPILPFLGLGAAMAIEDATILGRCLAGADSPIAGLDAYQSARRPRTSEALRRARRQGELYQHHTAAEYVASDRPSGDIDFMQYDAGAAALPGIV